MGSITGIQELAGLRDIHLPESIGWWPLAFGWYLLAALLLAGLALLGGFLIRRYLNGFARREAQRLLKIYQREYEANANSQLTASRVSLLLKRVALVHFPRSKVAGLKGEEWILFLTNSSKGIDFNRVRQEILEIPYQPQKTCDLQLLFTLSRQWISQRRAPCLN